MTGPATSAPTGLGGGARGRAGRTAVGAGEAAERRAGRVAVVGETARVEGYALAGAVVVAADTPDEVRAVWRALPEDVVLAVLTPAAAQALGDTGDTGELADSGPTRLEPGRLSVVMPS